ncbi:hypothetical protein LF1_18090 [Rubripirellula obstinata]|uniref:Uncharacterized protein n=1 Tax=Rubripirellula obstinata TaxID=406547 RepID=A0A5B1CHT7_9BACT|nr:hypothetical protein LF1_18090 [Rubripirellula obstinata]
MIEARPLTRPRLTICEPLDVSPRASFRNFQFRTKRSSQEQGPAAHASRLTICEPLDLSPRASLRNFQFRTKRSSHDRGPAAYAPEAHNS